MNEIFIIKLIASFFVGGSLMAILSFIVEKVNEKISGIILSFPSMSLLSFFFLGWTLSPEAVSDVIPTSIISLGWFVFFAPIYIYFALFFNRFKISKIIQVLLTFSFASIFWTILAMPIAMSKLSNFWIGTAGYLFLSVIAYWILNRKKGDYKKSLPLKYSNTQKIGRAIFMGFIIVLVIILGKIVNPFWAGVFAMFPTALSTTMAIFHWYYEPKNLLPTVKKLPIGSLVSFVYAVIVMYSFPVFGFIFGTIIAFLTCLVFLVFLIKLQSLKFNYKT